jgi:hypothetical protein
LAISGVVVVAGIGAYYFLPIPRSQQECVYSPGNAIYFQVLSDADGHPLGNIAISGQLVSSCPALDACNGSCGVAPPTVSTLGTWVFVTNATGYVSVPSTDLNGSAFWFNVTYGGSNYQAKSPICGGGATLVRLMLPSGALSGMEVPSGNAGVTAGQEPNGIQTIQGCNPVHFAGNA